ncbi:hypothetical protein [Deinococcus planocerae]|uniref:hypothetical protein n=1 Tax=Deinococcus planocerae TaxID=1737569 RepID=UPI000C7ECB4C|nr:hypothetical protein [Deinococcus planocerae]
MCARLCPPARRGLRLLPLACAALLGLAGAHGEQLSDLRGTTLCLDPASVGVTFEELAPARAARARQEILPVLQRELPASLSRAGVRHEVRPSCAGRDGLTRLEVGVRFLDPRHYLGFGDPAYSYDVGIRVSNPASAGASMAGVVGARRGFSSGWADIHSESRTGRPFEEAVVGWGEEQMRDLIAAWRRDNPSPAERVARLGPLALGLLGLLVGTALTGLGWWVRRRPRPSTAGRSRRPRGAG